MNCTLNSRHYFSIVPTKVDTLPDTVYPGKWTLGFMLMLGVFDSIQYNGDIFAANMLKVARQPKSSVNKV